MKLPQARAWKKFKVVELFDVSNTHCIQKCDVKNWNGKTPYVTASAENNSVTAYIEHDPSQLESGDSLVIGGKTFVVTYQDKPFFSNDSHNLNLRLKHIHGDHKRVYLFLAAVIIKCLGQSYHWGDSVSYKKIQKDEITIPVDASGNPDFAYMEAYVRELEVARIRELDKYLKAAGLDDCELTEQEKSALEKFGSDEIKISKTTISALFDVCTPLRRFNANAVKFGGVHPYVVRTSANNGQRGTIIAEEKYLNPGRTISFGQDTATIFYQPQRYFTGDKIKVLRPRFGDLNENVACYLLSVMRLSFSSFSWGQSSFNVDVLNNVRVDVPIDACGELDLAFMQTFITACMKMAIRGVIKWKNAATKTAVGDCN